PLPEGPVTAAAASRARCSNPCPTPHRLASASLVGVARRRRSSVIVGPSTVATATDIRRGSAPQPNLPPTPNSGHPGHLGARYGRRLRRRGGGGTRVERAHAHRFGAARSASARRRRL